MCKYPNTNRYINKQNVQKLTNIFPQSIAKHGRTQDHRHTHAHTHMQDHTHTHAGSHTHTMPIKSNKYIAFENHYSVANTLKLIIPIRLSF